MANKDENDVTKKGSTINIDINDAPLKSMDLDAQVGNRVGLSKDELMKYADQPFWVRLRNILFATFWIIWVSILVVAVGYVVNSPNCVKMASAAPASATTPLSSG